MFLRPSQVDTTLRDPGSRRVVSSGINGVLRVMECTSDASRADKAQEVSNDLND